jgi:nitrite reductase (NADH) small subunit/3-phenylpropionate/trans-cinnamate dioxygenase ferredoxin subunit
MSSFTSVAKIGSIPEGQAASFPVAGRMVAIFNQNGVYFALDDICPHMGASLAAGHVEGGVVTCPWHAWRFRVADGTWCDNPRVKTDAFEVRIEGDDIQVRVTPRGGK